MANATAKPAAASQSALYFPRLIFPACVPCTSPDSVLLVQQRASLLRIRCDILLQIQIIEQLEIRIHLVILFQSL